MTTREPRPSAPIIVQRQLRAASGSAVLLCADDRHVYLGAAPSGTAVATFDDERVWQGDHDDGVPIADIQGGQVYPHGGFVTDPIASTATGDPAEAALLAVFHVLYEGDPTAVG